MESRIGGSIHDYNVNSPASNIDQLSREVIIHFGQADWLHVVVENDFAVNRHDGHVKVVVHRVVCEVRMENVTLSLVPYTVERFFRVHTQHPLRIQRICNAVLKLQYRSDISMTFLLTRTSSVRRSRCSGRRWWCPRTWTSVSAKSLQPSTDTYLEPLELHWRFLQWEHSPGHKLVESNFELEYLALVTVVTTYRNYLAHSVQTRCLEENIELGRKLIKFRRPS